ncbi:MAG: CotH kinase family protein [Bacteroidota bacterium]
MRYNLTLLHLAILCTFIIISCGQEDNIIEEEEIITVEEVDPEIPRFFIRTFDLTEVSSREEYIDAQIEIRGGSKFEEEIRSIQIRGRGNSTWGFSKKPYQIRFDERVEMLGMPEGKRWILLANYTDKTMLRNEVGFNLSRMSQMEWTPQSKFIELNLNEDFRGTYQITQKVEVSPNRVNIGNEGFLLEVDQPERLDDDDVYFNTSCYLFNIKAPNVSEGDEKYTYISNFIKDFEETLFRPEFKDPNEGYRKYIDLDALIDWYLINEITKNNDAQFHTSVYMHVIPGGKLKMGPVWDFDISMGNIDYNGNETIDGFWIKEDKWITRFFEDPEFVEEVKLRFQYFYQNRNIIYNSITENADYIQESQGLNYERWETLGVYVWPNYVYFDTYEEEVDYLEQWLEQRFEWLNTAINEL